MICNEIFGITEAEYEPKAKRQPVSRFDSVAPPDHLGRHTRPITPSSRRGKDTAPAIDPSVPTVPVEILRTNRTQKFPLKGFAGVVSGFRPRPKKDGDIEAANWRNQPKPNDFARSPEMKKVGWQAMYDHQQVESQIRGSTPPNPQKQKSVSDRAKKEKS